ncbi:PREDICTED: programmed cell death protein 5-like [Amphimedon queenslandica]|uniref:Programmed cell death protein 5 n=1 Tax=Amphimedon queenslandica TaxID=400682 RepID=A0A1X7V4I5_AMPQE|nr:PREDICTED: programmed cell death protein 5-like [Amphimedon queenslandica]|eukprot:XP_003385704.1 PREDICTED: programmed cell death protein 5-like [Amphimedon queenslandica]
MADSELDDIRAKRLAELQSQYGMKQEDQEKEVQKEKEMINVMLTQILEQDARARLNSIGLVRPEKAQSIERMLIRMAQMGQIQGKLGESELVKLLEQVNQPKKTTVKFDRRKVYDSDSD